MKYDTILVNETFEMEALDNVSGGTNGEYAELAKLLPKVKRGHFGGRVVREEMMSKSQLTSWLKDNLNIDANISTNSGIFAGHYDDFSALGDPNTYIRNCENLSHSAVVVEVKNFLNAQ